MNSYSASVEGSTPNHNLAVYREALNQRHLTNQRRLVERFNQAQTIAQQAATLLKQEFQAQQVILFGSVAHGQWFSPTSDIDLAVRQLAPDTYFIAVARLQDLSPEFKIDLVPLESCAVDFQRAILQNGQVL